MRTFVVLTHAISGESHYIDTADIVGIAPAVWGCHLRLRSVSANRNGDWIGYRVTPDALLNSRGLEAQVSDLRVTERRKEPDPEVEQSASA